MKFELNDRVKVVKIVNSNTTIQDIEPDYLLGKIGIITRAREFIEYPYEIEFDDDKANASDNVLWKEEELELVESGKCCPTCGRKL